MEAAEGEAEDLGPLCPTSAQLNAGEIEKIQI
jgi:hypothetical protein